MLSLHLGITQQAMPVPDQIKAAFASGATILTANARAARWLRREYALEKRRAGLRTWTTPAIEDWDTWLRGQWQTRALASGDAPMLLSSLQERSVWTRMQRDDAALVVSPARVAAMAEGAYALLSRYEAQAERGHAWAKTDAERFRQWAASFDRECAGRNWMPRAKLEAAVAGSLDRESLPRAILLVGFDRITPVQDRVLKALESSEVRVRFADLAFSDVRMEGIRADGRREEIESSAWWVRERIERDPELRIGVLAPDLNAMRSEIERVFRRVLMPQTDKISADGAMPFEFSLGQPLVRVPAVRAALLLLRWMHAPLREEEISWLLLSGFLSSSGSEYLALAGLDARNRKAELLSVEISLSDVLRATGTTRTATVVALGNAHKTAVASHVGEEQRGPGRWVDLAQALLREAGWPGTAERDSLHFQAIRRWERALDEMALLDFDGQRLGYGDFLRALEAHAQETIFSLESQGVPVQIMGAHEASGQRFDAVWFLGADDQSWPARGRPHPLLPNDVQQRFKMPFGDAENDLDLAEAITARIAASAPMVVFSYALRDRDGELRPSPLLPQPIEWRGAEAVPAPIEENVRPLEEIEDASGVIVWPEGRSAGGSEVLKQQAACPFKAFATKRLRAEPLERSEWGLSAAERGKLLHCTLEKIWSPAEGALHSLEDLEAAVAEGRLVGILSDAIAAVFAKYGAIEDEWMRAYLASEQRRLLYRLEDWMRVEAARVPFRVIGVEEKLLDVSVGGLTLKLRADRIDAVGDSASLILDYKSGEVAPGDWDPPRPNEPQLPLYAVFGNVENVRGVLFARIRAGDTCLAGSVADVRAQLFADAKTNSALAAKPYTDGMRDEWHGALLNLAGEFLAGEAAVDPKEGRKTCEFCPLPPPARLCG